MIGDDDAAMIELLGVGAPREDGGWLLHRVCARFRRGEIAVVASRDPDERRTLLDAITGRLVPEEGRVWVNRLPVARDTVRRIRGLVADADLHGEIVARRSLLWNVLVSGRGGRHALNGLLRLPRKSEREAAIRALDRVGLGARLMETADRLGPADLARLGVASALAKSPEFPVVREVDFGSPEHTAIRGVLETLANQDRLAIVIGAPSTDVAPGLADRLIVIDGGLLLYDGPPGQYEKLTRRPVLLA
jgi:phosphonate transport system ATP-binding protein